MLGNDTIEWFHGQRRSFVALGVLVGLGATSCGGGAEMSELDEDVGQTGLAASSQTLTHDWVCPSGSVCEDIYDIDMLAGTEVTLTVISTTSTIRLGVFDPFGNPAAEGVMNLLTGTTFSDRRCSARPATDRVTVRLGAAGRYRFVIGRDPIGSSSDGRGNYTVALDANNSFTFQRRSQNDVVTTRSSQCQFTHNVSNVWNCGNNACQDMYDYEVRPGTKLTVSLFAPRGAPRLAVFGQFSSPAGTNLLTGRNVDRKCKAGGQTDTTAFNAVDGGVYHVAFGRDGVSTGGEGYTSVVQSSDTAFIPTILGQTQNDAVSQQAGSQCGYRFAQNASWSCASGSCQNTYDFDTSLNTRVDVSVTNVTGNSRSRLSLINNGRTFNSLNGLTNDRLCAASNGNDFVGSPLLATGRQRVSIGHQNAGSGNYTVTITTPDVPLVPRGQTVTNGTPFFSTTSCP